ncbi:MAG TPA: glycosyltransferase family 39 protein [Rhizomicrobium sp.]
MSSITAGIVAKGWRQPLAAWRLWSLLAIALVAWMPGVLTLPALDRDESRFAQASRQMVETGNYVDIRLGSVPRYNKPIGIYWLQTAVVDAAGTVWRNARNVISFYRLPSFFCGVLALLLTFWNVRAFASPRTGFLAAALLGATLLLAVESEIATTDAALLAAFLAAQGVLLRARLAFGRRAVLPPTLTATGWVAVGAGVLIKGPVIVAVLGATALAVSLWDREWRWLKATRPVSGMAIAIAVVAPWAIAIALASHGAFYEQSLGHDFAVKIAGGQESHGAPPGYYLALMSFTFWPATLFLIPSFALAFRRRNEPAVRFLMAWAAASFVLFEFVPTKLPHYILPAYPALAMLGALWIADGREGSRMRRQWIVRALAGAQFAIATLALAAMAFVVPARFGAASPPWVMAGVAAGLCVAGAAIVLLLRGNRGAAATAACACALIFYPVLVLGVAPRLKPLWISERVAALVARSARPRDPPVVAAGYAEPSLLFALGAATRFATGDGAANIAVAQGGLALVEDGDRSAFLARLSQLKGLAMPLDGISGFDYSRGRTEHLTLYRVSPASQDVATPGD